LKSKKETKLKQNSLSEAKPNIKIIFFSLENSFEEFIEENPLSGAELDFVQTPFEDLVIKQKDQKFRQLHEVAKLKTEKKISVLLGSILSTYQVRGTLTFNQRTYFPFFFFLLLSIFLLR